MTCDSPLAGFRSDTFQYGQSQQLRKDALRERALCPKKTEASNFWALPGLLQNAHLVRQPAQRVNQDIAVQEPAHQSRSHSARTSRCQALVTKARPPFRQLCVFRRNPAAHVLDNTHNSEATRMAVLSEIAEFIPRRFTAGPQTAIVSRDSGRRTGWRRMGRVVSAHPGPTLAGERETLANLSRAGRLT
jgi:hypothetical protein